MWLDFYVPVFGEAIRRTYPDIEKRVGRSLEDWRIGVRGADKDIDAGLEFQFGLNTPLTVSGSVKGPHVDSPDELIGGLLYMRDSADDSSGGELDIYASRKARFTKYREVRPESRIDLVRTVPYRSDTGVMFVNSPESIHGVSPRTPCPIPRFFISFCVDMTLLVFDRLRA